MEALSASTFLIMPRVKLFDEKEVLTKAMNLFWKQGYAATSVKDLVDQLGINRASLYDTFGDKDQLFKKAFELYRTTNLEHLNQFFQNHSNVKDGFSLLFENAILEAVHDVERKGCFVVNTTTELVPNDDSILSILEKNKRDFENLFYQYLKSGKESGQLTTSQDLKKLASLLYVLYNGIRVVAKVRPNKKELKESVDVALLLLT